MSKSVPMRSVPMLCGAKAAAGLFAAMTGAPLALEATPGCPCPVCVGITESKKLAGAIGNVQRTPAGIAAALDNMARHRAAQQQQPVTELQQGKDGTYS